MHGADEGNVIASDGLDNYPDRNIIPNSFDILVSNPPYAISAFKQHLKLTNKFYTLDKIANTGSEIETLFVERIAQLLKQNGIAAVILPSSILNKDGKSFIAARESLLQNFYIKAIVQLGSKTFSATGTNTVIMFLQKFDEPPNYSKLVKDTATAILNNKDLSKWNDGKIFKLYVTKIGVGVDDYRKFTTKAVDYDKWTVPYFAAYVAAFKNTAEYKSKIKQRSLTDAEKLEQLNQSFYEYVRAVEFEKIRYFALTYKQTTLVITAPTDSNEQVKFLGYDWSNRKGAEGIQHKQGGGLLYDKDNRVAGDKLSCAVRKFFGGEKVDIPNANKYYSYMNLFDMLDFGGVDFTKTIKPDNAKVATIKYTGEYPLVKIGNYIKQIRGVSYKPADLQASLNATSVLLLCSNNIKDNSINHDDVQFVSKAKVSAEQFIKENDILICASSGSLKHVGKTALCDKSVVGETFGAFCKIIRLISDKLYPEYIAVYFSTEDYRQIIIHLATGANIKNLKNEHIDELMIPLPPIDMQRQIVEDFNAVDKKIRKAAPEQKTSLLQEKTQLIAKYFH